MPEPGDDTGEEAGHSQPWYQLSREEALERLNAFHEKKRSEYRRLTGDDVQDMLRERRVERQQRRSERRRRNSGRSARPDGARRMRVSLGGALLVGAIGTGSLAASSTDSTQEQAQSNEQQIALLEGEIRALESESWDEHDVADFEQRLGESVEQAEERGEEVAELQNAYQEILADSEEDESAVAENREKLVSYFDESSRIIDDEESYSPGADVPYGPGEIDVLFPWYIRYADEDRSEYADGSLNAWELASVGAGEGTSSSVSVLWLNTDDSSGEVLVWARATYDSNVEKFHSLYVGLTSLGERPAGEEG